MGAPVKQHRSEPTELQPPACRSEQSTPRSTDNSWPAGCAQRTLPSIPLRSPARLTSTHGNPAATSSVSCVPPPPHNAKVAPHGRKPAEVCSAEPFVTRRKARKPKPLCAGDISSLCAEVAVLQTERRRSGILLQKLGPCHAQAQQLEACTPVVLGTAINNSCKWGQSGEAECAPVAAQLGSAHPARAARPGSSR